MTLAWEWLGRTSYSVCLERQRARRDAVIRGAAHEVVWLVEHPRTITVGRRPAPGTPSREALAELGIDFAKFTSFVPYPGTPIYYEFLKDGTIKHPEVYDFARYTSYPTDDNPTIYVTPALTQDDLKRLQKKAFRKFYLRPEMIYRHLFKIKALNVNDMVNGLRLVFSRD